MPDWTDLLAGRLASLSLRPAREREIIEELSQHLDDRYQELRTGGAQPDEAIRLALEEVEGDLLARGLRPLRQSSAPAPIPPGQPSRGWLADGWQDLSYAARMLRKTPAFTLAAILTLALGIGANTAIFSLVDATLLRTLPVHHRDRLFYLFASSSWSILSYPAYSSLRDGSRLLDGLAAWGGITASLNADGETDLVTGAIVTGNFFAVLGVSAEQGRLIATNDDVTPGAHSVAVISHRLWQSRFGARRDIVGTQIRLNGGLFTIVGVTPAEFPGPQLGGVRDLYVPMMMQAFMRPPRAGYSGEMNPDLLKNPDNSWLFVVALRKPGVSDAQVEAELRAIGTHYVREFNPAAPGPEITLVPIDQGDPNQRSQMRSVAALLGGVVGAVLLIACANVANLLLSRASARRREVAVRLALGASRWRIVRQFLTESVLLSLIGGAAGILVAWLAIRGFQSAPPPSGALPILLEFSTSRGVLGFSLALSVLTGLVFGVAPALQASRPTLVPSLKDETFVADERSRRFNLKRSLVVAEVMLSVLLLITAGLFVRSLRTVRTIEPGFAVDEIVSAPLSINLLRYTRAQGRDFYQRVTEQMRTLPGVRGASVARIALMTGNGRVTAIAIEGRADDGNRTQSEGGGMSPRPGRSVLANVIGPEFFATLGIPFVRGRDFTTQDAEDRPLVAIVNETMAKQFFSGKDPIGKRFATSFTNASGRWTEIVGVVRDSKYTSLSEAPSAIVYMPIAQRHETGVTLYVRAAGDPGALIPQIRHELQTIEPNLPVPDMRTMTETIGASLYAPRMGAVLLTFFGGLALLLASLGVYAVLAFSIARRTREIGIRMALGADRRRVFALVIGEGMTLVGIGLALGLAAGFYASTSIGRFLYEVSPRDVLTYAVVPCVLAVVAFLACYLPARRAMRVDPMTALRES